MTVTTTLRITLSAAFLTAFSLVATPLGGCSGAASSGSTGGTAGSTSGAVIDAERLRMPAPGRIVLEPVEGPADTVGFHIGSPLFLRMRMGDPAACAPKNGEFFYFDAGGTQLGWGFEEVVDTLLFPAAAGRCERIVMLSSEASNRLAEGRFTMRAELFLDPSRKLGSDTLALHPVRSTSGADEVSYARFLMEQIVRNGAQLRDPETVAALFGEGVPTSAESEIYRAVVLYRIGDFAGAVISLRSSRELEQERRRAVGIAAATTRTTLETILAQMLEKR
jgi:hypothetical protein